jgi:putative membrane protein
VKHILTLVCCISLCSIAGLAQKKNSKPAMSDQQFVDFAGQTDMVDANLGQLAGTAASSEPIKGYAQKVVNEQTDDFHQLSKAAHQASLKVPSAIDEEHNRTMIDPFQKLKGTAFDRRFVEEMVDEDNKAIAVYKNEAAHAQNLALSSYAEEALPILQGKLAAAKKMETTMAPAKKG